eukprot:Rhum_TRINITY_DN14575_c3_g1::Rhum_TRINITY_DN14575_c3_g1_i1::g.99196::m.99196
MPASLPPPPPLLPSAIIIIIMSIIIVSSLPPDAASSLPASFFLHMVTSRFFFAISSVVSTQWSLSRSSHPLPCVLQCHPPRAPPIMFGYSALLRGARIAFPSVLQRGRLSCASCSSLPSIQYPPWLMKMTHSCVSQSFERYRGISLCFFFCILYVPHSSGMSGMYTINGSGMFTFGFSFTSANGFGVRGARVARTYGGGVSAGGGGCGGNPPAGDDPTGGGGGGSVVYGNNPLVEYQPGGSALMAPDLLQEYTRPATAAGGVGSIGAAFIDNLTYCPSRGVCVIPFLKVTDGMPPATRQLVVTPGVLRVERNDSEYVELSVQVEDIADVLHTDDGLVGLVLSQAAHEHDLCMQLTPAYSRTLLVALGNVYLGKTGHTISTQRLTSANLIAKPLGTLMRLEGLDV